MDVLHSDNHKACAKEHHLATRRNLRAPPLHPDRIFLNSQAAEQANSRLRRLQSSIPFMKPENFMLELVTFLAFCNFKELGYAEPIVGERIDLPQALLYRDDCESKKRN